MKNKPIISAVICTRNRANYLKRAIQSLLNQTLPKSEYEIIVVDNNSNDKTKNVINLFTKRKVKYVFEPRIGVSFARNTGLKFADAKYIAYLDDDAIADPTWLERILWNFENVKPTPVCIGGKVSPIWETRRPKWLSDDILLYLTVLNLSNTPRFLKSNEFVFGVNFAFLRDALLKVRGFDEKLGRSDKKSVTGEDILPQILLRKKNLRIYYDPSASVRHNIQKERLTKKWVENRMWCEGETETILTDLTEPGFRKFLKWAVIFRSFFIRPLKLFSLIFPNLVAHDRTYRYKCLAFRDISILLHLRGKGRFSEIIRNTYLSENP